MARSASTGRAIAFRPLAGRRTFGPTAPTLSGRPTRRPKRGIAGALSGRSREAAAAPAWWTVAVAPPEVSAPPVRQGRGGEQHDSLQDARGEADQRDPLVDALDGAADGHEPSVDQPDLAGVRARAPADRELQAEHRSAVHRQGPRGPRLVSRRSSRASGPAAGRSRSTCAASASPTSRRSCATRIRTPTAGSIRPPFRPARTWWPPGAADAAIIAGARRSTNARSA